MHEGAMEFEMDYLLTSNSFEKRGIFKAGSLTAQIEHSVIKGKNKKTIGHFS